MTDETHVEDVEAEKETGEAFNIWAQFETDQSAEENGAWYEILPEIKFKLRRFQSDHAVKTRQRLEKPYVKLTRGGKDLPQEVQEKLITSQLAESIIVDWEGITDRDGNVMDYSIDNAKMLLEGLPHVRDELVRFVLDIDNYRVSNLEQAEKN